MNIKELVEKLGLVKAGLASLAFVIPFIAGLNFSGAGTWISNVWNLNTRFSNVANVGEYKKFKTEVYVFAVPIMREDVFKLKEAIFRIRKQYDTKPMPTGVKLAYDNMNKTLSDKIVKLRQVENDIRMLQNGKNVN